VPEAEVCSSGPGFRKVTEIVRPFGRVNSDATLSRIAEKRLVTRPRQVLPGEFYLITRNCSQRQFLLTPDDEVNNAIAYCLAHAAQRFKIDVLMVMVESNHHHTVIYDRHGHFPRFIEHFHKMVAKCINRYRDRRENLWASGETCVTRLLDYETVLDKIAYAAANPVKDFLVERAAQWPGLSGYRYLIHDKPLVARRPRFFFRADRGWPESLSLKFTIPSKLGERDEVVQEIIQRVGAIESQAMRSRQTSGRRLLGRKTVMEQHWRESPRSLAPERTLRPRFAGRRDARMKALEGYEAFLAFYDDARTQWLRRGTARFPQGTYWLARFTPLGNVGPIEP
jgi:putative transposase